MMRQAIQLLYDETVYLNGRLVDSTPEDFLHLVETREKALSELQVDSVISSQEREALFTIEQCHGSIHNRMMQLRDEASFELDKIARSKMLKIYMNVNRSPEVILSIGKNKQSRQGGYFLTVFSYS